VPGSAGALKELLEARVGIGREHPLTARLQNPRTEADNTLLQRALQASAKVARSLPRHRPGVPVYRPVVAGFIVGPGWGPTPSHSSRRAFWRTRFSFHRFATILVALLSQSRSAAFSATSPIQKYFVALLAGDPRGFNSPAATRMGMSLSENPSSDAVVSASTRAASRSLGSARSRQSMRKEVGSSMLPKN